MRIYYKDLTAWRIRRIASVRGLTPSQWIKTLIEKELEEFFGKEKDPGGFQTGYPEET